MYKPKARLFYKSDCDGIPVVLSVGCFHGGDEAENNVCHPYQEDQQEADENDDQNRAGKHRNRHSDLKIQRFPGLVGDILCGTLLFFDEIDNEGWDEAKKDSTKVCDHRQCFVIVDFGSRRFRS